MMQWEALREQRLGGRRDIRMFVMAFLSIRMLLSVSVCVCVCVHGYLWEIPTVSNTGTGIQV